MIRRLFTALLLACVSLAGLAQKGTMPLYLKSGTKTLAINIQGSDLLSLAQKQKAVFGNKVFAIVQFQEIPSEESVEYLKRNQISLLHYLPKNSFLAEISLPVDQRVLTSARARALYFLSMEDKVDPLCFDADRGDYLNLWYFETLSDREIQASITDVVGEQQEVAYRKTGMIRVAKEGTNVEALAQLPFVYYIENHDDRMSMDNRDILENPNSNRANTINSTGFTGAEGLTGKGINALVVDGGKIDPHLDLNKRVVNFHPNNWSSFGEHAELVTGVLAGSGNLNPYNRGVAYKTNIYTLRAGSLLDKADFFYNARQVRITNNSYGSTSPVFGNYLGDSRDLDLLCNDKPDYLHFTSASNFGQYTYSIFPKGFHTVNDDFKTSKNSMVIGNLSITDSIMKSSSKGPTKDGRIKPEFCANGSQLNALSRDNNYKYVEDGGTSSATPSTAGATVLLSEYYHKSTNSHPESALIKNVLANTADDLGNSGPDFTYGYGRINARRALKVLKAGQTKLDSVGNGNTTSMSLVLPTNLVEVRLMLTWNDPAANIQAFRTLINDLDLELVSPTNTVYKPWILKHAYTNVEDAALRGKDSINNIEQITLRTPVSGTWTVRVKGYSVTSGKQPYFLTWENVINEIVVTYPNAEEKLEPGQTFMLRWDAYDISPNSFTVDYTTNYGQTWTTINNNVNGAVRYLEWTTPAVTSGEYKIRVSRNSSTMTDQSDHSFTVAKRPTGLTSNALCVDYSALKWNSVSGAQDYTIWYLDTVMKPLRILSDTTDTVPLFLDHDNNWFAVSANFSGYEGQRCEAVRNAASSSGNCPYQKDLTVNQFIAPLEDGRKGYQSQLRSTESITIKVINRGQSSMSGFNLAYQVNGGSVVTQQYGGNLLSGDTLIHTFSSTVDMSAVGTYSIKTWTSDANDLQRANDTLAVVSVKQYANPMIALPFSEKFTASLPYIGIHDSVLGLTNYPLLDYKGTSNGQLRHDDSGGFYLEAKSTSYEATNYLTFNLNLSSHTSKSLSFKFKWTQFSEGRHINDRLWVRGSDTQPWIEALNLYDAFSQINEVEQSSTVINLTDLLYQNSQAVSATTQMRFGQQDNGVSIVTAFPYVGTGGVRLRDFELFESGPDLSVMDIVHPQENNCGYPGHSTFSFNFRNAHHQAISGAKASMQVDNSSPITYTLGSISGNDEILKSYSVNNLGIGWHTAKFWVEHSSDTFPGNDTIDVEFYNSKQLQNFPYIEDFESNDGFWLANGTNSSWEWGGPSGTDINQAGSGSKCWVTDTSSVHNTNEHSYLNSPCFKTTKFGLNEGQFEALIFGDSRKMWVEYSNDAGETWAKLGEHGEGVNWYDSDLDYWTGSFRGWHRVKYDVPNVIMKTNTQITFRFVFSARDNFNFQEGFAIDSFALSILDQDLKLLSLNGPQTSCGLSANEQLSIRVANLSGKATGWVPVRYTINGGSQIKDSIQTINSQDTITHNLRITHDFTNPIAHEIDIWLESELDRSPANDSIVSYSFVSKPEISTFPYAESYEANIGGWHGTGANSSWEQGTVNSSKHPNNAHKGSKCWATNLGGDHIKSEVSFLVSPCFDLRNSTSDPYLEFHSKYTLRPNAKFYVEYTEDGSNWSKLGTNGNGLNWYNHGSHYFNGSKTEWTKSRWQVARNTLTDSSSVQFRFVFENDVNDNSTTAGIAIDYVRVYEIQNDLELVSILSPTSGCDLGSSEDIEVRVKNNSSSTQNNATLYYSINGGAAQSTSLSSINANTTVDISLSSSANFASSGNYSLKTWVGHNTDTYQDNDSATFYFLRSGSVSSFPYQNTFESNNGGWFGTGTNSSWAWGAPGNAPISQASQGQKAWMTNLSGSHNTNELSYLNSPCFDLDQLTGEAHISFWYYRYLNTNTTAWVEYSDDNGNTWTKLGTYGEGVGWYNHNSDYWAGQASGWKQARMRLPLSTITNKDQVKLRWVLSAGAQVSAGLALDDFRLYEVKNDAAVVSIENPSQNEGSGSKSVTVTVANCTQSSMAEVIVKYQLNSSTVVKDTALNVPSDDTASFTFTTNLQLTSAGNHTLKVWTDVPNDNISANDTATLAMTVEAAFSSFPYYESFEASNGGWTIGGTSPSWEWGSPDDALTNEAAHGQKCMATDLDGNVNTNELSYFNSPLFDFRGFSQNPVFSFYNIFTVDWQSKYYIEYTEDDNSWTRLGQYNSGTNWYNHGSHYWSQSQTEWKEGIYDIPLHAMTDSSKVRFRFVLDIGSQSNYPGIAVDDIFIGSKGTNLQVIQVAAPDTSCGLGSTETVTVVLFNFGAVASGSYDLNYSLNGGSTVSQQFSSINASAPAFVSFTTKANLSTIGQHDLKVWTTLSTDHYKLNDTLEYSTFKSATVNSFPYSQDFESGLDDWVVGGTNSSWEVGTPSSSSFTTAANGTKCVATNLDGECNTGEFSHLISPCFDFSGMSGNPTILFNLAYNLGWTTPGLHVEYSEDGNTWTKLGSSGSGTNWYNNNWDNVWDQSGTTWTLSSFEIPLGSITDSSAVKFRFVLRGSQWSTAEGVVIDDIRVQQVTEDLKLVSIDGPSSGAGLGQETVTVKVQNLSSQNLSNVFVYYRLDGGIAVKDTIPSINSGATSTFNFTVKTSVSSTGTYVLEAWTGHANDNQPLNDTVKGHVFTHTSYVSSFPYFENFETDNGKFYSGGTLSSWEHGTLSSSNTNFKKAASGTKVWGTDLNGHFSLGETSYLYSPVFDLSGFSVNPILSLSMQYKVGFTVTITIEYSEDGSNWTALTSSANGVNWSDWGWTDEKKHWHNASTEIPVSGMTADDSVQFRVHFTEPGWAFETFEGLIVDNFHIHEKALMHMGTSAKGLTKTVSGTSWIHFEKNGNRVMSIHPQNQNLGSTTVDCYVDQGNTRSYSDQYLLDRSWVVNPTSQPNSAVKVRLYYSDIEVDSLRLANNCVGCTGVDDAFSLTFTKYHGTNEDSLLTNNTSGTYAFFDENDLTIVPYGRGYCAEFEVTSFSEIFGSGGGTGGNTSLPVELIAFTGKQVVKGVLLEWQTSTELNNERFEIQRSKDALQFETIGTANGQGTSFRTTEYDFVDALKGVQRPSTVFYRLKQSDFDGTSSYSRVLSIRLEEQKDAMLQVWPTVFQEVIYLQNHYESAQMCAIVNAKGLTLQTITLQPGLQSLALPALPAGIYHLHLLGDGGEVLRLVKE